MPVDLFGNVAETTLSGAITDVATSITVVSSADFPAASSTAVPPTQFRAAFVDASNTILEYLLVTNVSGTTWTIVREAESTTRFPKAARANGTKIVQVVTTEILRPVGALASYVRAGRWSTIPRHSGGYPSQTSFAHQILFAYPFWVPKPMSADAMACYVEVAGETGAVVRFGVWSDSALLLDAGTAAASSSGVKQVTFGSPLALAPGVVWFGMVSQSAPTTAPKYRGVAEYNCDRWHPHASADQATDAFLAMWRATGVIGAMPNQAPVLGINQWAESNPKIGVRWT